MDKKSVLLIRIVGANDDGGIRQSERQLIPEFRKCGAKVVGIVVGSSLGNFADQAEDFPIVVDAIERRYQNGVINKMSAYLHNKRVANRIAGEISERLMRELNITQYARIIINVRKVTLVALAHKLAIELNGQAVLHIGRFTHNTLINRLYYGWLKQRPRLTLIANSRPTARHYGLSEKAVVYPGLDITQRPQQKSAQQLRNELKISATSPVFLYLARLSLAKAPDVLLEAFLSSAPLVAADAHIVFVGPVQDDEVNQRLVALIGEYRASARVHVVGRQANVSDWYSMANVFVNSNRGYEGFGISIIEAMACGVPVLSSALGGPSETIEDGRVGWLTADLSRNGYQRALERALNDRDKWSQMGEAGRVCARKYSADQQARQYLALVVD
ncbi:glycosyltransferase family 4 protein [Pseudidiomarina salilacus]|uniref:glycosyltransferase family 4 protein n=1 Tax=Pseudidiomarina salilacus TaxID=3384452 RepID=UPI003984C3C8